MRLRPAIAMSVVVAACSDGGGSAGSFPQQDASAADAGARAEGGIFIVPRPDGAQVVDPEPTVYWFEILPAGDAGPPCSWSIPEIPDGQTLDTRRLRLVVLREAGIQSLYRVGSSQECDVAGAWYFDDLDNPRLVILCPETCASVADARLGLEALPGPVPPFK